MQSYNYTVPALTPNNNITSINIAQLDIRSAFLLQEYSVHILGTAAPKPTPNISTTPVPGSGLAGIPCPDPFIFPNSIGIPCLPIMLTTLRASYHKIAIVAVVFASLQVWKRRRYYSLHAFYVW